MGVFHHSSQSVTDFDNSADITIHMDVPFYSYTPQQFGFNMSKRPHWESQPPLHSKTDTYGGDSSGQSRISRTGIIREDTMCRFPRDNSLPSSTADPRITTPPLSEEFQSGESYDEYLSSLLFDFGLQLSPGGTRIELDQSQLSFNEEVKNESDKEKAGGSSSTESDRRETQTTTLLELGPLQDDTIKATTLPYSKFRKITAFSRSAQDPKGEEHLAEAESPLDLAVDSRQERGPKSVSPKRKVKKYEVPEPLADPEEERKRLNAINARRNRMKQKEQTQELKRMNRNLEEVNQKCSMALRRINTESQKLRQELEERNRERSNLEHTVQEKENEIRKQREKLILFRGHLDLIASSLDEDNPAKRLILNLLNKLPNESSGPNHD